MIFGGPGHQTATLLSNFENENMGYTGQNATIFRFLVDTKQKITIAGCVDGNLLKQLLHKATIETIISSLEN